LKAAVVASIAIDQAKDVKDDAKIKIESKIKELEASLDKDKKKLKDLAEAGKDKCESLMEGIEKTMETLASSIKKMRTKL
jgi:vacuolar-type H+-ATPase subunit I/STV1